MADTEKTTFLERIENRLVLITRPIAFIGVLGMLIIACITVFDVLWRWLFKGGVTGLTEVVAMVFAVAVAACIPSGVARRVNLRIDILSHWITGRLEAWMNVVGAGLLCLFYSLLMWRIFIYADSLADQARTTTLLLWPMAPFMYAVAVLLGAASIVQAVVFMNTLWRALALGWKSPGCGAVGASSDSRFFDHSHHRCSIAGYLLHNEFSCSVTMDRREYGAGRYRCFYLNVGITAGNDSIGCHIGVDRLGGDGSDSGI